jgi:hypothetical protein
MERADWLPKTPADMYWLVAYALLLTHDFFFQVVFVATAVSIVSDCCCRAYGHSHFLPSLVGMTGFI